MESSITCLINDERASTACSRWHRTATSARRRSSHSDEMVDQSYFEHTSPAGVTFMDRIEATGYMHGARTWTVGENLVWGTGPLSTPQALVDGLDEQPAAPREPAAPQLPRDRDRSGDGTPVSSSDLTGVTVSSEYGYRTFASRRRRSTRARRGRRARPQGSRLHRSWPAA